MDNATPPLTTRIVEWLKDEIEQNRLVEGGKLPSEKQLCEQFGVSRSVVREAISQLKSEGLVSSHQGRGVFVNARSARQSFRLSATALDDRDALEHIIELLVAFESAAARHAAMRHTAKDLKSIRRALIGMEYAIINDQPGDSEDYAFHQAICDATHNPHFIALNEYLEQHVRRLIRRARTNTVTRHPDLMMSVQTEHQAILKAIQARDGAGAAQAAETHLRNAARRLDIYLKE
ncbi:FadR/GntR family transcriptional regulator [Castellaniella defragrans]|jgi:DNA-binding FadR family transcriptional regulator|uniref:Transcriptional regulator, GntR family n=2 Tax=Castellaniella defragrans TaxID=75697 RepID=W8X2W2_CASD6|nr:FadR/GntR family transcriptional regulator [Castellaniella defragrans]KAB0600262.1 FadR family transcriptional regulator [Castellaniella defragrans]MBB6082924.1 DNA-binding FadR family transcriptional regulator [Castellaniella defragrans]CDM23807.1 Transcriptional regulator, GntR family [Castellaniella defragrans 65Phen]